jgi:nucleotide-binding universal stress UspA family protein
VAVRRILVGYDGSDGASRALDKAIEETRAGHGKVTVLAVAEMPLDPSASRNFGTPGDISDREGQPLEAPPDVVEQLVAARDRLAAAGIAADIRWAAGEPARAIVDAAQAVQADVIIVGEHHHGFLSSVFGADVAAEVRREVGCDVIVA